MDLTWRMPMSEYTPMIQQYLQVKQNYADTFLFFRLGDFYELFFEDAVLAAKELEITLTSRVGGKEDKIPMCGVPHHSSEQYIRKLIDKGHRVAICEQVEDPKQAKGVVKREVVRVLTPGTLMEKNMLSEKENNYILFLSKENGHLALVSCDLSTGEVMGTEMNSIEYMLEEIIQYQAAEIVIDDTFSEQERNKIAGWSKKSITCIAAVSTVQTGLENEQGSLLQGLNTEKIYASLHHAVHLMHQYLSETQKRFIEHLQPLQYYQSTQYLLLDSFSRRNLELTETIRDHSRKGSLLWLLDETSTAMGGRLIKKWLQKPLMNRSLINQRLDAVSALLNQSLEREELSGYLEEVYDLERLAARVSYGNVNPKDLLQLKKSLQVVPKIISHLHRFPFHYMHEVTEGIDPCEDLAELLEAAIVDDAPFSIKDGGIFRSGYHQELDRLLEASRNGKQWIARLETSEREKTGIKTLKIGYNRIFGYYIEVTKANIHLMQEGRYERKQTLANAERYVTPELKEKEALILEANDRMFDLEYQLFLELRDKANTYTSRLQKLAQIIAEIDVLCSFAKVSEKYHYVRPTFSDDGSLNIKNGRHPVVEKVLQNDSFVANHLFMDNHSRQILLITGPNMAGKSTYMRQTALLIVMAQAGCFVPADEALLPNFDQIFTRIGAADDLVGGQSTFMVEMLETKQAITKATANSLILLDEIGRGTSTYDGMSLAQSVIEYIHDHVQAKTLFSTHYHELTALEAALDKLTNVHVACSEKEGKVIFLHTVKEGKADRSYGIHVAQLANMPEKVIVRAKDILSILENKSNNEEQAQLSFFSNEEGATSKQKDKRLVYLKQIEELEIATMTPVEALNTLFQLQQKLKKTK